MKKTKSKPRGPWISFRAAPTMRGDLQAIAQREGRTVSNLIRLALSRFIVEQTPKRKD